MLIKSALYIHKKNFKKKKDIKLIVFVVESREQTPRSVL